MDQIIKLDVISGFLGAGKTTFILKMLETVCKGEKVAVLENEFGKINLDGTLLSNGPLAVKELSAGCICCQLAGPFEEGILQLIEEQKPDRILIEPTGVARLSDVLATLERSAIAQRCMLERVITIVDASRFSMMEQVAGAYFDDQLVNAGCVAVSKTEGLSDALRVSMVTRIYDYAPEVPVFTGEWTDNTVERICASANLTRPVVHLEDDGEVPFQSTTLELTRPIRPRELAEKVAALDDGHLGEVLRVKGIFRDNMGGWRVLQAVPGDCRIEEARSPSRFAALSIIGRRLNVPGIRREFGTLAGLRPVGRLRRKIVVGNTLPTNDEDDTIE